MISLRCVILLTQFFFILFFFSEKRSMLNFCDHFCTLQGVIQAAMTTR